MKLIKETKSPLLPGQNSFLPGSLFVLFIIFFAGISSVSGQNRTFEFHQTVLSDAIVKVSKEMNFPVAFDAKALEKYRLSGTYTGTSPEQILSELLVHTNCTVEKKYGNYLIVPLQADEPTLKCQISGWVSDLYSGEQLPNAHIFLPDQNHHLTTTVNGTFSFKSSAKDSIRLNIQYIGYYNIDSTLVLNDSSIVLNFRMRQRHVELETIDVKKARERMIEQNRDAGHSTINPNRFGNLPNMGESDIFRTIQLLPGVSYSESSSGLNIRGGSADQNLVLFDGFSLYNLDHFFGTFSSINPNVVKDIQIYKGGFDSRYGERVSGLIDITGKTGDKYAFRMNGGLNMVSGNLTAEIPISKKINFVVAGRRSYADIYSNFLVDALLENHVEDIKLSPKNNSIVQLTPGFYFYDYNAKLTFSQNEMEKMSLSIFGGKDYLTSAAEGRNRMLSTKSSDDSNWGNYGISYSWMKQWESSFFSNLQIGYSGYHNEYTNQTTVQTRSKLIPIVIKSFDVYEKNRLSDFSVCLTNNIAVDPKNSIDFGFQSKYNEYSYLKQAGNDAIYVDNINSSWLNSIFSQLNNQRIENLNLKFGGRISLYNQTGQLYFEPRFSGNYRLSETINIKFATGRYIQFLSKIAATQNYGYNRDFWVVADGNKFPVQTSNHFIAGSSLNFGKLSVDMEGYYKSLEGLQLFLYIPPYQQNTDPGSFYTGEPVKKRLPSKFITGQGKAYGVDVLLKYESTRYTGWMAYSRSIANRNFFEINEGETIPAPFEKANEFKLTNLLTLGKWNLSLMFLYSDGQPYVVQHEVDQHLNASITYEHLPDYKRLDISANYNFRIEKAAFKLGLSIINLLDAENLNDIYSRDFNFDSTSFNETTYVKSMGITPNFFLSFQF